MSTLAEFVAARLTEHWEDAQRNIGAAQYVANTAYGDQALVTRAISAMHVASRTVRVIEAQRRTLARHEGCGKGWGPCDANSPGARLLYAGRGCPELLDLAAPDHSHPGFNPAWKIEDPS